MKMVLNTTMFRKTISRQQLQDSHRKKTDTSFTSIRHVSALVPFVIYISLLLTIPCTSSFCTDSTTKMLCQPSKTMVMDRRQASQQGMQLDYTSPTLTPFTRAWTVYLHSTPTNEDNAKNNDEVHIEDMKNEKENIRSNSLERRDDDNDTDTINAQSLDEFLDSSYFDPDLVDEDDRSPIGWFANLVKNDYELAETIYAGSFFFVLLIITQELLRMQLYGDAYVPFTSGGSAGNGKLF